jgi:uroporphyrinogen-III synthase
MPIPTANTAPLSLQGMKILLTRPESQSAALRARLRLSGAIVESLPALEISPVADTAASRQIFMNIDRFNTVVFISPNAAHLGARQIDIYWPQLPEKINWLAVGQSTADVLRQWDIEAKVPALSADSEGMLSLPALTNCQGQSVLIVRGEGGRELLAETLTGRGANVQYAEVYRRECPQHDQETMRAKLDQFAPDLIIFYSDETLQNLLRLSDKAGVLLRNRLILVPGERAATQAKLSQFERILIPESLKEADIVHCVENYWQSNQPGKET